MRKLIAASVSLALLSFAGCTEVARPTTEDVEASQYRDHASVACRYAAADRAASSGVAVKSVDVHEVGEHAVVTGDGLFYTKDSNGRQMTYLAKWKCTVNGPSSTVGSLTVSKPSKHLTDTPRLKTGSDSVCVIKGNVSFNTGDRIYHVPGQRYYNSTTINESYGEQWFCTEKQARAAGWRKSRV